MESAEFAARIDHTLLDKDHTSDDVVREVERADSVGTNVCLPPNRVDEAAGDVDGELMTVLGFPMGYHDPEVVAVEAERAVESGADSVDLATDVSALKSGDLDLYRRQVEAVVEAADHVKAILEMGVLSEDEIEVAAEICVEEGVDYLKTCTGFVGRGVTVEDAEKLSDLGLDVEVKASGGVRTAEDALSLVDAGAGRVGSSSGVEIVEAFEASR